MSKEYADQQVREGNHMVTRFAGLSQSEIEKLSTQYEGQKYVPVADAFQLIEEAVKHLERSNVCPEQCHSFGFSQEALKQLLVAMLRVPVEIPSLLEDSNFKNQTDEEIQNYRMQHSAAVAIAKKLNKGETKTTYLEEFDDLVSKSCDPLKVKALLLQAKPEDQEIQLPSGILLAKIAPLPKTYLSKELYEVSLRVQYFDETSNTAFVKIQNKYDSEKPALKGLLGRSVAMKISNLSENVRSILLAKQLIRKSIGCRVSITRSLRATDEKYTFLSLVKLLEVGKQKIEVTEGMNQIQLKFEEDAE